MQLPPERVSELEEERRFILERKIAFAREPLVSSVSSVSFPVFNFKEKLLGAVTIVGFSESIPQNEEDELSHYLIQISKEISIGFGYRATAD